MKIATISHHGCIRMHKMNTALIAKAHEVHLITSKVTNYTPMYKTYQRADGVRQTLDSLRLLEPRVDLLHAHNEPSWYVSMWKEISDKPVILDVHDSFLARVTPEEADKMTEEGKLSYRISVEERNNFQMADGLVFPGEKFASLICKEFDLKQPRLILPSYMPETFYRYDPRMWLGGLVYEGKINLPEENEKPAVRGFNYCDYTQMAKEANQIGIDFHLYGGRNDDKFKKSYNTTFNHPPMSMPQLLKEIGCHDWGLIGNTIKTAEWDIAMPNKLFDYMAAGVPIVCINASATARFVLRNKIGIVVNDLKELAERWREHVQCRRNLFKVRNQFSMDSNIHLLENFYEEVKRGSK